MNPFKPLEKGLDKFILELKVNGSGFLSGDIIVCQYSSKLPPGTIAILESNECGRWPLPTDSCPPEIEAGAKLIGYALCLYRNLSNGKEA